jgi:thiamine pyrophosphate-dependent acetolactate synthase large subunit-like protein
MDPATAKLFDQDFAAVARAMGATGCTVRTRSDLQLANTAILDRTGPVLIDLKLDVDRVPL